MAGNKISALPALTSGHSTSDLLAIVDVSDTSQGAGGTTKKITIGGLFGWQSYTPTFTNFTLGNGTVSSAYMRTGNIVHWYCSVVLGSTSVVSGRIDLSAPVNIAGVELFGNATFTDSGTAAYPATVRPVSSTTLALYALNAAGSYLLPSSTGATVPFTWTTGDGFAFLYTYRVS